MKCSINRFFTVIALSAAVLLLGTSCQEHNDIEKEAIKAAIQTSSEAFHTKDFDLMLNSWVNDESVVRIGVGPSGKNYTQGWEAREAFYKNIFNEHPEQTGIKEVNSNFNIKVYGRSAWAVYDVDVQNKCGESIRGARHTSFLEKENGQWKLVYLSTVITSVYEYISKNLENSGTYHKPNTQDIYTIYSTCALNGQ